MELRSNKPLRNFGVYQLRDKTLILVKRSDVLSFLFSPDKWHCHGPVEYRVSHGNIYCHGRSTKWTDDDLWDTGRTAKQPSRSFLMNFEDHK